MSATNRGGQRRMHDFYRETVHGYLVGRDGHVYSDKGYAGVPFRRMTEGKDRDGYSLVQLSLGTGHVGRTRVYRVHKLMAEAFLLARPSTRHEIRHLDGNKSNNSYGNLAWGTRKDNADDREKHGRTARGERQGHAKLTAEQVVEIRQRVLTGETQTSVARSLGVCTATVNHIIRGRNWRAA